MNLSARSMPANEALRSSSAAVTATRATSSLSSESCARRVFSAFGSCDRICSSSFCSAWILASTSLRMASGSAANTSGLTTLPSCIGAMAKPIGVRSTAMFCDCALLIQCFERLLLTGAVRLVEGAAARLVLLALEHGGQRVA